ncbi:hypothetical protein [Parvibaculum sp.]|uniref:hypothetical protein n=1 Tax=Parvibaculum sp. TaxID=2024848 RepID=UPI00391A7B82
MKKPIAAIAATMLSLVLAAPSWAGSSATVDQVGDGSYTLVVQNRHGTKVTTAQVGTVQHYQAKQAEKVAVLSTTRAPQPVGVKFSGSRSGCPVGSFVYPALGGGLLRGANSASVVQAGMNNTAIANQSGDNNRSRIIQQGNNHYAATNQTGNNNSATVIQKC